MAVTSINKLQVGIKSHTNIIMDKIAHMSWRWISNFNISRNVFEGGCDFRKEGVPAWIHWGTFVLEVHIWLEYGDGCMLQKVELSLGVWWSKNANWFPIDFVAIFFSMFSRSTLDVASRVVGVIIESKTCFVLFYPLYEGTTCLANIELITIPTQNFVYDIFDIAWGSSRLGVWQERLKICIRVEWGADVVTCQGFLQGWCRGFEIRNRGHEVTVSVTLGLPAIVLNLLRKSSEFFRRISDRVSGFRTSESCLCSADSGVS